MNTLSVTAVRALVAEVNKVIEDAKRGTTVPLTATGMVAVWVTDNNVQVTQDGLVIVDA